ncbi:MAG TPA: selenide, water dikinase SelD [Candidatus Krumholzibacterium sp.]|nr:selenide, water dikinase SelD [Candidatus Krumholzibacterium sp.]
MTTKAEIEKAVEVTCDTVKRLTRPEARRRTGDGSGADVKLTRFTHGLGCACKLRPQDLEKVLEQLPSPTDENVLVGKEKSDDAAVYRLSDEIAVVQTVDFFTPIVDDPFTFGAIAAANSLSDLYAMGARPLFGLNIVGFPEKRLPLDVLRRILEGALSKADEAEISIIGGHTIEDPEPKYGLAVTGIVHPSRVLRNSGAGPGHSIILTKPLGTGIIATAMKRGSAPPPVAGKAIEVMSALNRTAAESMEGFTVSACTDVTGFGLMGHLLEMTRGSGMDAVVFMDKVPFIEGVRDLVSGGDVPGGTVNNMEFTGPYTDWDDGISTIDRTVLCDAQTSGGLLIALPEVEAVRLLDLLIGRGVRASIIGRFGGAGTGRIRVSAG